MLAPRSCTQACVMEPWRGPTGSLQPMHGAGSHCSCLATEQVRWQAPPPAPHLLLTHPVRDLSPLQDVDALQDALHEALQGVRPNDIQQQRNADLGRRPRSVGRLTDLGAERMGPSTCRLLSSA